MALTKKQRAILREKFGGKCAYCGCELPDRWHADHAAPVIRRYTTHIDPVTRILRWTPTGESHYPERDNDGNMFPACPQSNLYKSSADVEGFRTMIERDFAAQINRSQALRAAQRFGQLHVTPEPIVFWFEKFEQVKPPVQEQK